MPEEFKTVQEKPTTDWTLHPDATYLTLAILIGSWQDKNQYDLEVITQLLGISYDEWLRKAREILHYPDSPLSLKTESGKLIIEPNFGVCWDRVSLIRTSIRLGRLLFPYLRSQIRLLNCPPKGDTRQAFMAKY